MQYQAHSLNNKHTLLSHLPAPRTHRTMKLTHRAIASPAKPPPTQPRTSVARCGPLQQWTTPPPSSPEHGGSGSRAADGPSGPRVGISRWDTQYRQINLCQRWMRSRRFGTYTIRQSVPSATLDTAVSFYIAAGRLRLRHGCICTKRVTQGFGFETRRG